MRNCVRKVLPDCIFITLNITKEIQKKRLLARHGEGFDGITQMLINFFDIFELPGEDEDNTYNVDITEHMTAKDVLNQVLEVLEKNCK